MATRRESLQRRDQAERPIREEFLTAVRETVRQASVQGTEQSASAGQAAVAAAAIAAAMNMGPGVLADTVEAIREAYKDGGKLEAAEARISFDIRNPRAEQWLRRRSSEFVTNIGDEQREAIRIILESGMRAGRNPRQTALDIIGRVNETGRRRGGVIGLTSNQAQYVANAREELRSGDSTEMRRYLSRGRRDRRFDATVRRHIETGTPVPVETVDRIVGRYSDRLLELRGTTVARTEAIAAFSSARDEAWRQSIEAGNVDRDLITKTWSATMDARTRATHRVLDGNTVAFDDQFVSPSGARLLFPGDPSAPPSEVIDCRCYLRVKADWIGQQARREQRQEA